MADSSFSGMFLLCVLMRLKVVKKDVDSANMHFCVAVGSLPLSLSQMPTYFPLSTYVYERAASLP